MIDRGRLENLLSSQDRLITTAQALDLGFTTDEVRVLQARGEWVSVVKGVNLTNADMFTDSRLREMWWRAALLAHGGRTCLMATTGARAFRLVGLPLVERTVEIGCVGGISRHPRFARSLESRYGVEPPRIVARQLPLLESEIVQSGGFPVRQLTHTLVDSALVVDRATVLCLLDSALYQGLITRDTLVDLATATKNRRGVRVFRQMVELADERAESQTESRVRLACIDGCVPPDDLQYLVRTGDGHAVARGDLAWYRGRKRPLLGEADGRSVHDLPDAVYRDRFRGNALVGQACDTVRFTFADSFRPGYIAAVVRAALAA